ncbi:hypothetical protein K6119_18560 [Paracrocinitomix mangrovi]|uniref:hypothetical protein n=1 Tax=Paracrocinitomix mangrovi TaxID=2862509 RepID=UPI001C8DC710|nr:hypothetical protein [Paracrocinitomix mangrovi]UKN01730.1 hypothetical protein K6119_18560 [Paracrocinitomix mangrovi]
MDHVTAIAYQEVVKKLESKFGEGLDLDAVVLIIGVQELGKGFKKFSKDEKMNLMHIAICTILEPYGYYKYSHEDEDGWPHFDKIENLPALGAKEQESLLKEAVIQYFEVNKYL